MKKIFSKVQYRLTGKIQIERTDWTHSDPTFRLELLKDEFSREMSKESLAILRDEITSILELNV